MSQCRTHLYDQVIHEAASNIWLTSHQFDVFGGKEHGLENPVGLSCRLGRTPVDCHPVGSAGINFVFHRNRLVSPMDPAASQRLRGDRKSTRLNSSHVAISYAV